MVSSYANNKQLKNKSGDTHYSSLKVNLNDENEKNKREYCQLPWYGRVKR